jgi:hypothetical protein
VFLVPEKREGLENTKSTAGTNGKRNQFYFFRESRLFLSQKY